MVSEAKTGNIIETSKNLGDIKTFDDMVSPEDRKTIFDLEKKVGGKQLEGCPCLAKEGKFFYYCKKGLSESDIQDKKPSQSNKGRLV